MSWYKTGSVSVTTGSASVIGVGTKWLQNALPGDALRAPDGRFYEINEVVSQIQMTISPPYEGQSVSGAAYQVAPVPGRTKVLADRAAAMIAQYEGIPESTEQAVEVAGQAKTESTEAKSVAQTAKGTAEGAQGVASAAQEVAATAKNYSEQFDTTKVLGVPSLISAYATKELQQMLNNRRQVVLTKGVYKLDEPLYPYGGSPGEPQEILAMGDVEIYQAEMIADIFRVGGKPDTVFRTIPKMGHRMSDPSSQYLGSGGKAISDRNSSGVSVKTDRITIDKVGFYEVAMQGIINWGGGENWLVSNCKARRLGRELFFTNGGKFNRVESCDIDMTGDDALAFAQSADGCSAVNNIIRNAGRYNLGGSGIRANGLDFKASGNQIYDPSVFGIVLAETSDRTSRPDDAELTGNSVIGLIAHGANNAFLAAYCIQNARRVTMRGGLANLRGTGGIIPAIRIYGDVQTESLTLDGFVAREARDRVYIMGAGIASLAITKGQAIDCANDVAMQDSPVIGEILIDGSSDLRRGRSVLRLDGATSPVIGEINVQRHRSVNPATGQTAISLAGKSVTRVELEKNKWAGSTAFASAASTADLWSDGDHSGVRYAQGTAVITAGATSVTITHGIKNAAGVAMQPGAWDIEVHCETAAVAFRVYDKFAESFKIGLSAAAGTALSFRWRIAPHLNHYVYGVLTTT